MKHERLMFEGKIIDAIDLRDRGVFINAKIVRGVPRVAGQLRIGETEGSVLALDDKGIVTNGCLDGEPLPPQIRFLTDLPISSCQRDGIVTQHIIIGGEIS